MKLQHFLSDHGPLIRRASLGPAERRALTSASTAGLVVRLLPGIHVSVEAADDLWVRAAAVMMWDPDAVLTGRLAAHATFWPSLPVSSIDVSRRGHPPRCPGYLFHERVIDPAHVIERRGLRVTSPALTAIDLVDELGGDAIDTCLRSRAADLDQLWSAWSAHPSRPGNNARRLMLLDSRNEPWSAAERLAHRTLRGAGVTGWTANHPVVVPGGACYFIDIAFCGVRLAVEIDGRLHEDDPSVFENDRYRQNQLVAAGWTVLRFTYAMLVRHPDYVIRAITDQLTRLRRAVGRH